MNINIIVAADKTTGGIGKSGTMPWHISEDLKWFKKVTTSINNNNNITSAVIMGRKTYESIGKPLPNRYNIILTKNKDFKTEEGVYVTNDIYLALAQAYNNKCEEVYIIGGGEIYKHVLELDIVNTIYIDFIDSGLKESDFDTFFDISIFKEKDITTGTDKWVKSDIITYNKTKKTNPVVYYRKKTNNNIDAQYLTLMSDVLKTGTTKHTRAGDTLSLFGRMMDFDVSNNIACLTTKKMFTKGCITELLWFLNGDTNIKYLIDNGCNIWTDDAYRYYIEKFSKKSNNIISKEQFIKNVKLQSVIHWIDNNGHSRLYTYGDLGPVYGRQWTKWNKHNGTFINQIDSIIYKLKTNPDDRRLIVSAWNVGELDEMALPPCHYCFQLYTKEMTEEERKEYAEKNNTEIENVPKHKLSLVWSQRSVDICLGLPYNMLSYSILLYIIAKEVNMVPDRLKCFLGDCHIYKNQIEGANTQLKRNPYWFVHPNIDLNNNIYNIYDYNIEDICIKNYEYSYFPTIKFPLSVGL